MAFKHTFKYLLGKKELEETRLLSASRAIRYLCLDCSGGSQVEVKTCRIEKCPVYPFRMGKSRPAKSQNPPPGSDSGEEN